MDGAEAIITAALAPAVARAAGIIFRAPDSRVLFLKRSGTGDHAGEWCFPGGGIEADETPEEAAAREAGEEAGCEVKAATLSPLCRFIREGVDYTTFVDAESETFVPILNDEHTAWAWALPDAPPEPMHPGARLALAMLGADELGVARMMAFEGLTSPQRYKNVHLFDLRFTGTGVAYRAANKETGAKEEFVIRDPEAWCTEEMLARCNGLPVVFEHPEKSVLDSKEFGDRIVGTGFLPYIKGAATDDPEVWVISKIYDAGTAELMANEQMSTSPGVVVSKADLDAKIIMDDGRALLREVRLDLIDHIAICAQGVWDKAADPVGVRLDSVQGASVAEKTDETVEELRARLDAANARADSAEAALAARADSSEGDEDKGEKADEDKSEDEDGEKADSDEGGESKKDAAEEDPDAAKKDAAVDPRVTAAIAALDKRIPKPLTDADMNELAAAQERADGVAHAFGERASRPMPGEAPLAYRRRLVTKYQAHSAAWKDVDLAALPPKAFDNAEGAIYADAEKAATTALLAQPGTLRERIRMDDAGRRIKEYEGDPAAWMDTFKGEPKFGKPGFVNTNPDARR